MKQFQFRLDTVLNYKQQTLDSRLVEHGLAIGQVKRQEEVLASARGRLAACEAEYNWKKAEGLTIAKAQEYQMGLQALERIVLREAEELKKLKKLEEEKRLLVVEAKKETSSLEKLKEIKHDEYLEAEKKAEEKLIDELAVRKIVGNW